MANRIDQLVERYKQVVSLPWERHLAGPQRVWFAIYDKSDERRLRYRLSDFEAATTLAAHRWREVDLTDAFARWMGELPYRDAYFEDPSEIERVLPEFQSAVVERILGEFRAADADTVVALRGVACLFGLLKVSDLVQRLSTHVPGRLLVLFPGEHEGNNYRLLDARDGWNYLAVPIS
ncbi:MAG TPA: DUF1788 domain-containing protein, partial [Myxococcota bacterium]|nr:DUF1788 domain-containing protein [Myxococcota bacterium]